MPLHSKLFPYHSKHITEQRSQAISQQSQYPFPRTTLPRRLSSDHQTASMRCRYCNSKDIKVHECATCDGRGKIIRTCTRCEGERGQTTYSRKGEQWRPCRDCRGDGNYASECESCQGQGCVVVACNRCTVRGRL